MSIYHYYIKNTALPPLHQEPISIPTSTSSRLKLYAYKLKNQPTSTSSRIKLYLYKLKNQALQDQESSYTSSFLIRVILCPPCLVPRLPVSWHSAGGSVVLPTCTGVSILLRISLKNQGRVATMLDHPPVGGGEGKPRRARKGRARTYMNWTNAPGQMLIAT